MQHPLKVEFDSTVNTKSVNNNLTLHETDNQVKFVETFC